MRVNYPGCLDETLKWEGGYSNHPSDPGGATMRGVTQKVYDQYRLSKRQMKQAVRRIQEDELQEIYRDGYWYTIDGDALPSGLDCSAFDLSVNSGPGRARQYLASIGKAPGVETIKRFNARRMSFLRNLGTFKVFGKGWTRRVAAIEAFSIRLASGANASPILKQEARKATAAMRGRSVAATGTAAAGAGGSQADMATQLPTWGVVALSVVLVAMVAGFAFAAWQQSQRAEALEDQA